MTCVMSHSVTYAARVRTGYFCVVNFVLHSWLPHSFLQTTRVQMRSTVDMYRGSKDGDTENYELSCVYLQSPLAPHTKILE